MKKKQTQKPKQRKRKYQKRVSMYGVPLDEAVFTKDDFLKALKKATRRVPKVSRAKGKRKTSD